MALKIVCEHVWEGDVLHSMLLCCWIYRVLMKSCCDGEYYLVKKYVHCGGAGQPEYPVTMPDYLVVVIVVDFCAYY